MAYQTDQHMELLLELTVIDIRGIQYPYDDALVVTAGIANHNVHRVLVDNGSSINILSRVTYDSMSLPADKLRLSPTPLYGFSRQCVT